MIIVKVGLITYYTDEVWVGAYINYILSEYKFSLFLILFS